MKSLVFNGQVIDKVSTNVKARGDSLRNLVKGEISEAKAAFNKLVGLKPVQAVNDIVTETVDNVGDFIDEQCEITRRWATGI